MFCKCGQQEGYFVSNYLVKPFKRYFKEISLLFPKFEEHNRNKRPVLGIVFKEIVGIASESVSAFIRHRKSRALYEAVYTMRQQQNFQVNRTQYLEEPVYLNGTYSANNIEEIVDVINCLHKIITKHERY